jgi:DNA polymerase-3 subunit chi
MFDGRDADAVARARSEWQTAKEKGHDVSYWQQDESGRWQKKA